MTSKLGKLQQEEKELINRLRELEAEGKELRGQMVADPLNNAARLSAHFAQTKTQVDVFSERLGTVKQSRETEEARINSPEVQKGLKQAEKIIADNAALCKSIDERLAAIANEAGAAFSKANQAAALFHNGGRDGNAAIGGDVQVLLSVKQLIDSYSASRVGQTIYTKSVKDAQTQQKEREKERASENEARISQKKGNALTGLFTRS